MVNLPLKPPTTTLSYIGYSHASVFPTHAYAHPPSSKTTPFSLKIPLPTSKSTTKNSPTTMIVSINNHTTETEQIHPTHCCHHNCNWQIQPIIILIVSQQGGNHIFTFKPLIDHLKLPPRHITKQCKPNYTPLPSAPFLSSTYANLKPSLAFLPKSAPPTIPPISSHP